MVTRAVNAAGLVMDAWEDFISNKSTVKNLDYQVRTEITDSWIRCRKAKVNPLSKSVHCQLEQGEFEAMLKENMELINVAKPFMDKLYQIVAGSGFVVVLSDVRGYIMEILGDKDTLKNPITVSFFCGASWSETEAGTNAIGTALVAKKPVQVSGAEHYCRKHHCLTCSAAPILDAHKKLLGVLDVSGASNAAHLHTMGMVVAAAEAIMAQFSIQRKNKELREINTRLANVFNTMSDGVIMIDKSGIINELNPVAKRILGFGISKKTAAAAGIQAETVLGNKNSIVKNLLTEKKSCVDVELMLDANKGFNHCVASGEPVIDEQGIVTGGVIILRPIKQVKSLINKLSGYHSALKFSDIIGESKGVLEAVRVASLAAASFSNVLLQGESGTGKEIFAQAIHNRSARREGPFIAVNCGAIPRELVGSELFGYEDGSFTGAKRGGKPGKFELAYGGTLFLDEIADMPLEQQVVLLRALQERKISRIGGDKTISVNARVICATNKRLLEETKKGTFREDLYYRLHVISITIPPLRERSEDIVLLFNYFLDKMKKNDLNFEVSLEVIEKILRYDWPGNVRELQNVVERIISLAQGNVITLANLPQEIRNWESDDSKHASNAKENHFRSVFEENEKQEIFKLLCTYRGNISLVARNMGVSRNTLYRKMKQYNLRN